MYRFPIIGGALHKVPEISEKSRAKVEVAKEQRRRCCAVAVLL